MNLLAELLSLVEAPARIHANGKLTVLADLIEEEFGEELNVLPMWHKCLIAQIAYIIKARTGLTMNKIIHLALMKYIKMPKSEIAEIGERGTTPDQTIKLWNNKVVSVARERYRIKCAFHSFHGVSELITAVKQGHPVLVAFNIDSPFADGSDSPDDEGRYRRGDEEFYTPPNLDKGTKHHVLLAVGVDEDSEEIILRDIRSTYLYKGYIKVPFDVVDKHIPLTFTFDVDLVKS